MKKIVLLILLMTSVSLNADVQNRSVGSWNLGENIGAILFTSDAGEVVQIYSNGYLVDEQPVGSNFTTLVTPGSGNISFSLKNHYMSDSTVVIMNIGIPHNVIVNIKVGLPYVNAK